MPLMTNLQDYATRVATEFRIIRAMITGTSTGDLTGLTTADKTSIIAAINEVDAAIDGAGGGGAASLDELTDVNLTGWNPAEAFTILGSGGFPGADGTWYTFSATDVIRENQPYASEWTEAGNPAGAVVFATQEQTVNAQTTDPDGLGFLAVHTMGLRAALDARIDNLVGAAPGTLDTIEELATALTGQDDAVAAIESALGMRVRVDEAQTFTAPQQAQGRANIGAQSAAEIGDTTIDLVAVFNAALTA